MTGEMRLLRRSWEIFSNYVDLLYVDELNFDVFKQDQL